MAHEGKEQGIGSILENLSSSVTDAFKRAEGQFSILTGKRTFAADVLEYPDSYTVLANLPGLTKEDLEVVLEAGRLTIRIREGAKEEQAGEGQFLVRERIAPSGARSFDLPNAAETGDIEATFKDGVLKLRLLKSPKKQARKVDIS